MVRTDLNRMRPTEERHPLCDHEKITAPHLEEPTIPTGVDAVIACITEASSAVCSRVLADAEYATVKLRTDAGLASTRLTLVVEMAIAAHQRLSTDPSPGIIEDLILDPWGANGERVSDSAMRSAEAIERDADAAMAKLRDIGRAAISDIHNFAVGASLKAQVTAGLAAEKLGYYRRHPHSIAATLNGADKATEIVVKAADDVATILRQASDAAIHNTQAAINDGCARIKATAEQAARQIETARDRALGRIQGVARIT